MNIEGLCPTPEGELLIGFRNPIPGERALIVPLKNPGELIEGKPARFGDLLTIAVRVEKVGTKSVTYRHEFSRDRVALAVGRITAVYVEKSPDGGMRSAAIPAEFRAKLEG